MARRLGWLLFIGIAAWLLAVSTVELIPATRKSRDAFRELAAHGVDRTATVVAKRDERIEHHDGDHSWRFYVTLEYAHGERTYQRELPFNHLGLVREAYERVAMGDRVDIKAHPQRPEDFYAPSFLELNETFAPVEVDFIMYCVLGLAAAGLLLALVYFKVFRSRPI
jgi:hypothetical protein